MIRKLILIDPKYPIWKFEKTKASKKLQICPILKFWVVASCFAIFYRFGWFWVVLAGVLGRFGWCFGSFWLVFQVVLAGFGSLWLVPSAISKEA